MHANYVDAYREAKKFILTQAPVEATLERFWSMVWQENSTMIVAVTVLDGDKTPLYIPPKSGESKEFGKMKIVNMGVRHVRESYDATILMIGKENEPMRKCLHILFYGWPHKGTPTRPTEILHMLEDVNFNRNLLTEKAKNDGWLREGFKSPIIVHCSDG